MAAAKKAAAEERRKSVRSLQQLREEVGASIDEAAELADASNAVIDLVQAGRLDEAERAARELLVHYPQVHDGYDRLGMVYQARGQNREAADCYRKVIEFVETHPDQCEPDFAAVFRDLVAKLDPPATA